MSRTVDWTVFRAALADAEKDAEKRWFVASKGDSSADADAWLRVVNALAEARRALADDALGVG